MRVIFFMSMLALGAEAFQSLQTTSLKTLAMRSTEEPVEEAAPVVEAPAAFDVTAMAGVTAPFGFFDPLGLSKAVSEERVKYFRESEIKHGRVAMLAALGFPLAEKFHPLFGGQINVPSYVAYQETPLQTFWPVVVLYIGFIEVFSIVQFESPFEGKLWTIKASHVPGSYDFDPLDQAPSDPVAYAAIQNKEINNGRLAMIAIAGMVAQELSTGKALF